jgi:hypothetical protein
MVSPLAAMRFTVPRTAATPPGVSMANPLPTPEAGVTLALDRPRLSRSRVSTMPVLPRAVNVSSITSAFSRSTNVVLSAQFNSTLPSAPVLKMAPMLSFRLILSLTFLPPELTAVTVPDRAVTVAGVGFSLNHSTGMRMAVPGSNAFARPMPFSFYSCCA